LALLEDGDILLITGNIFSRLGPFSHIELFIMPWTVNSIFHEITPSRHVMAITSNVYIKEDRLIDPQFGRSVLVKKLMYLYDSERNVVSVITPIELEGIMEKRPREIWHWVQLLDKQSRIRRFISTIVK
tara:strand:+ start:155 stop:541 length:387 start_codon:yes stop_codon:yes gene_type:complete